ncbi:9045_t:CDS:2, partial [Scutellospora calospora]
MIFSHILQPILDLIRIASQQTNISPKTAPEEIQLEAEILWPNPIEINFIRKIILNDDNFLQSKLLDDKLEMSQRLKAQLSQDFTFSLNHDL